MTDLTSSFQPIHTPVQTNYHRRDIALVDASQIVVIPPWHVPTQDLGILIMEIAFVLCVLRLGKWLDERVRRRSRQDTRSICSDSEVVTTNTTLALPIPRSLPQCTVNITPWIAVGFSESPNVETLEKQSGKQKNSHDSGLMAAQSLYHDIYNPHNILNTRFFVGVTCGFSHSQTKAGISGRLDL